MNTDRLSLFTTLTGPRGACKTLMATSLACQRLLKAYYLSKLRGIQVGVWSNYPVAFRHKSEIDGEIVHLESQPLNMESFYTFDDELTNGWVFIDEIDQWYDRQEWASVTQKLLNKVMTQIRKKKLTLVGTIQDPRWLNSRGQFQVDIQVNCREAAFSPWGRKMGLDLGECSYLSFRDMSGVMTGYKYDETGRAYNQMFWGRRFWDYYDTDYQFNPLETATKYKLKVPTKIIEVGGNSNLPDDVDSVDPLHSERKDRDFVLLADIVEELKAAGYEGIKKAVLRDLAVTKGVIQTSAYNLDKFMRRLGVGTSGRGEYNLINKQNISPLTP